MALASTASRRYAGALVEAAAAIGPAELTRVKGELETFSQAIDAVFDLKNVLLNPVFTKGEREKALEALMQKLALGDITKRFLRLIVINDRVGEIGEMAQVVKELADAREGRVVAEVKTASELSPDAVDQLRRALERKTGRKIELSITVDPSLIGGVQAKVGSQVFDGTIRAELDRLRGVLEARN